jgi:DhnA family fructose-bisphosphate aldolase class Ia
VSDAHHSTGGPSRGTPEFLLEMGTDSNDSNGSSGMVIVRQRYTSNDYRRLS